MLCPARCVLALLICGSLAGTARAITVEYPSQDGHVFSTDERQTIQRIADQTEREVRRILPKLPQEIVLEVRAGTDVISETGDNGVALDPGRIGWMVDATRAEGVKAIAERHLRAALFHEMHHLVRGWTVKDGRVPGDTVMDAAISEGLATAFARDFANARDPWSEYPKEVASWAEEVMTLPKDAAYDEWMFKHPDGRRWIGYKVGVYVVDQAIAASGRSAADLATTSAEQIVALWRRNTCRGPIVCGPAKPDSSAPAAPQP
jgi:hypothetical protein